MGLFQDAVSFVLGRMTNNGGGSAVADTTKLLERETAAHTVTLATQKAAAKHAADMAALRRKLGEGNVPLDPGTPIGDALAKATKSAGVIDQKAKAAQDALHAGPRLRPGHVIAGTALAGAMAATAIIGAPVVHVLNRVSHVGESSNAQAAPEQFRVGPGYGFTVTQNKDGSFAVDATQHKENGGNFSTGPHRLFDIPVGATDATGARLNSMPAVVRLLTHVESQAGVDGSSEGKLSTYIDNLNSTSPDGQAYVQGVDQWATKNGMNPRHGDKVAMNYLPTSARSANYRGQVTPPVSGGGQPTALASNTPATGRPKISGPAPTAMG